MVLTYRQSLTFGLVHLSTGIRYLPIPSTDPTNVANENPAFYFFNRKNCAPVEMELVTKNCPPKTGVEFV